MGDPSIRRYSSRITPLGRSFLAARLQGARSYDRIAGFFSSSLLEVVGEELGSISGAIRLVCNSDLAKQDILTARAAKLAEWKSWTAAQPELLLDNAAGSPDEGVLRERLRRLYELLRSGKLQVRVLPDRAFGLVHGKAGVITLTDGTRTCFLGSVNESRSAWQLNYELVWEDPSAEAVAWVQEEFDALWQHPQAVPLAEAIVQDIERLAKRQVMHRIEDWTTEGTCNPAPAIIETPVYRQEAGLWEHQKYFVKTAFEAHCGPLGRARFVLADQVGLGKTIQLAMTAQLIALTGSKPILVICPKTLVWQWQDEMISLLAMPSAVWDGRRWVDENEFQYPVIGPEAIRKCPRRVGIVSAGLISRGSEIADLLLKLDYDCVILDEAHHARRRNLGANRDNERADPTKLLAFMYQIAERTRSLLLATATPVQIRPIEAWDLLDILSRGDDSVLGNMNSYWRSPGQALGLVMEQAIPTDEETRWEWTRNPFPPKNEGIDYAVIRNSLRITEGQSVIPGDALIRLSPPDHARLRRIFPALVSEHNPFICRIIRRTREQLERQIDTETNEPLLKPIKVELLGDDDAGAILLPAYLREAYTLAEEFCRLLSQRLQGSGFLKTLLLRRVGSSIFAGMQTAKKLLSDWVSVEQEDEDAPESESEPPVDQQAAQILAPSERNLLLRFIAALEANKERDPKYAIVLRCLRDLNWLDLGCIVFSQYYDSISWLAEQLTKAFPDEQIALYSGANRSFIIKAGQWNLVTREVIKERVRRGELRLLLGTDAASEGLNLQRLATLINLDLPWNPTRLEQRKGRIQRIGQIHDTVQVYNLRYKDSVEDRVHELLSSRLHDIYTLFGQIPDVLEDAWIAMALGDIEQAKRVIDALPYEHPFEVRYTRVEKVDWESCSLVLSTEEKRRVLSQGW